MSASTSAPSMDAARPQHAGPGGTGPSAPPGLLEAKLLLPRSRPGTVRRTRLLRQLRAARDRRVISILAPPGYGKTSLLAQWASQHPRSAAWLTVDGGDNDPVVFLTYLAAAIDRVEPLDPNIFGAIASPAVSSRAVVGRLLAAMSERPEPVLLAIDDAHRITDRACLDALAELITYLPAASQVAIAGREPPALPFARWRVEGSMLEIGPGDLAMDEQEAAGLGRQVGLVLSAEATAQLTRQTEGWPALLALASLGAQRSTGRGPRVDASGDRLIADYLRSELLEGHSGPEITFLTRTSILERLSGPVCDVVAGRPGSADLLASLARSTLLVDEYGGSYRYHTLLRDFLRRELAAREPKRIAGLHQRAATWYGANGDLDLAVDHAFAAGDLDLAAVFGGRGMLDTHWSGRRATVRAWFSRFSDPALEARPWLAVLAAWEELAAGDVASTVRLADIAERGTFAGRPPDGTASFESGRAMLRAAMARQGADDALANASLAVELEGSGSPWRDFALWQLAMARFMKGDPEGGDSALADAVVAARSASHVGLCHCLLGHRALLAADRRDWNAADAFSAESDEMGLAANTGYLSGAPARAARARIAIQRGEIAEARRDLARAMSLRPLMTAAAPALSVQSLLGFARAHLAIGDPAGAQTLLAQASQVIRLRPDLGILPGDVAQLRESIAAQQPTFAGGASTLTATELRVLALLPYYLSFKEIGQRLGVKATTVKTHALAIYGKLGASTRSEAVDLAVDAGLLDRFLPGPAVSAIGEDAGRRSGW
jgi:LuxR family transcriptional regulator, maltose regulon positive regulatory protein